MKIDKGLEMIFIIEDLRICSKIMASDGLLISDFAQYCIIKIIYP